MANRMARTTAVVAAVAALAASAAAKDAPTFAPGKSAHVLDGLPYELYIPHDFDKDKTYSLIVTIGGSATDFEDLASEGYITCAPGRKIESAGGGFSAGEVKGFLALTRHLMKALPIGKDRVHAVGESELYGVFSMFAFDGKSPFVSACFNESACRTGSVGGHLRKRMGVLAFDFEGLWSDRIKRVEEDLKGKVRTVELRRGDGTSGAYFRYWLGAMEGRFVPGHDRSFSWEDMDAGHEIRARMQGKGAFLYFFASEDATKKEARELQNVTFFKQDVRRPGKKLAAFKFDRAKNAKLFDSFGLKATPAVVVLDRHFKVIKAFSGRIKVSALAKAMRRAAK